MRYREVQGDLFTSRASLAHCVSSDFHMNAGIAKQFRKKYPNHQSELLSGRWRVGEAARVKVGHRYFFYLVTKPVFNDKPTEEAVRDSIFELARWAELLQLKELALPKIACGLDGHEWSTVRSMIWSAFHSMDIAITVYYL